MVDAVVSDVVERLGDFLIEKAAFLIRVRDQVECLKDELRFMQHFIKHTEEKQYGDATIHDRVSDIRELAYDIEDLLDMFHRKVHGEVDDDGETMETKQKSGCFPSICCCIFNEGKEKVELFNIGMDIEKFKNRINELSRRRQLYGLQDSSNSREGRLKAFGQWLS
ncbi:hypothetical protein QYF36_023375 [Acer negundo]|nr:hypothetical protein QYF36_023375 [Acer negundo]